MPKSSSGYQSSYSFMYAFILNRLRSFYSFSGIGSGTFASHGSLPSLQIPSVVLRNTLSCSGTSTTLAFKLFGWPIAVTRVLLRLNCTLSRPTSRVRMAVVSSSRSQSFQASSQQSTLSSSRLTLIHMVMRPMQPALLLRSLQAN